LSGTTDGQGDKRSGVIVPYVGPGSVIRGISRVSLEDGAIAPFVFGEPQFSTEFTQECTV
jgi:hypothetical protein